MLDPIFWASLGIALSILLAAIGAGLGIGMAGPGVAGAITEKPEIFARSFIAVVLAEALAIYGLVVALLAVFKLPAIADPSNLAAADSAFRIFAAGLAVEGGVIAYRGREGYTLGIRSCSQNPLHVGSGNRSCLSARVHSSL